ncbi:MAG: RNA polymerase sigma factor [Marmoricola sp.]
MTTTEIEETTRAGFVSDQDCVGRILAGDLHAFAQLYERHHAPVHAAAATLAGHHLAGELTDEAFASLFTRLRAGSGPGRSVRYFLLRLLREQFRRHRDLVARGGRPRQPLVAGPIPFGVPDDKDSRTLAAAFGALPDDWRQVLWLRTLEGLGEREIAEALELEDREVRRLYRSAECVLRIAYVAAHLDLEPEEEAEEGPDDGRAEDGGGARTAVRQRRS